MNKYTTTATPGHGAPEAFLIKFGQKITGVLSGFDRILFRASLRLLFQSNSMEAHLASCGVLLKNFGAFFFICIDRCGANTKKRKLNSCKDDPMITNRKGEVCHVPSGLGRSP